LFGAINLSTGKSVLFIPKLTQDYTIWCGPIRPPQDFLLSYAVDEVLYLDDMISWLTNALENNGNLHLLNGVNTDSGHHLILLPSPSLHLFNTYIKVLCLMPRLTAWTHSSRLAKSITSTCTKHWLSAASPNRPQRSKYSDTSPS